MSSPVINTATRTDADRCIAALVTAFTSDPLTRWMFPEPARYLAYFGQLLRFFAGRAFEHDAAYRSDDYRAAALWLPPGIHPDEEAMGALLQSAIDESKQEDVFAFIEQVGSSHPEMEHWYLPVIGVDPYCQGAGYGSALLAKSLEACDRAHQAAYLESSNPRNVPLYQKFGFEVVGEIQAGSSPAILPMLRAAR